MRQILRQVGLVHTCCRDVPLLYVNSGCDIAGPSRPSKSRARCFTSGHEHNEDPVSSSYPSTASGDTSVQEGLPPSKLSSSFKGKERASQQPQRNSRRRHAQNQRVPRTGPMDTVPGDPIQAVERLGMPNVPRSSINIFDELVQRSPVFMPPKQREHVTQIYEASRTTHNEAVHKVLAGLAANDWTMAFHQGWLVLDANQQGHRRVGMRVAEKVVRLWSQQSASTLHADWEITLEKLLLPVALREIELQNEHSSCLADWMFKELQKANPDATKRVLGFWNALTELARKESLGEERGDPYHLLQIPVDMFNAALAAYYIASIPLGKFIRSFADAVAVPAAFAHTVAAKRIKYQLHGRSSSNSSLASISTWTSQMLLLRIWARAGERSIHAACAMWRSRMHGRAASEFWDALREGLLDVSENEGTRDPWLTVAWDLRPDSSSPGTTGPDSANPPAWHDEEFDDGDSAQQWQAERSYVRPPLPFQVTPAIIADLVRTLLHLGLRDQVQSVWNYVQQRGWQPPLQMWNALLIGHSHNNDLVAAEAVFKSMQETSSAKPDAIAWATLVSAYFKAKKVDAGLVALKEMMSELKSERPNLQSTITSYVYNTILNSLFWNNVASDLGLQIFEQMQADGVQPDTFTVNILLRYYSRRETFSLDGVTQMLETLSKHNLQPDAYTLSMLLDALVLAGRSDALSRVQEVMHALGVEATTATFSAMISHTVKAAIKHGDPSSLDNATKLLRHMQATQDAKARPTEITYSNIIQGHCRYAVVWNSPGHLEQAERLHDEMIHLGIPANRITYNSLMSAHLAFENISQALEYFNRYRQMKTRRSGLASSDGSTQEDLDAKRTLRNNVPPRTWQTLVTGLVDKKQYSLAQAVINEMQESGLEMRSPAFQKVAAIAFSNKPFTSREHADAAI